MIIGEVETFPNVKPSKEQAAKVLEEAAEVFGAWQLLYCDDGCTSSCSCQHKIDLLNECADLIQATCNLVAAFGVDDMSYYMELCRERNQARGRYE